MTNAQQESCFAFYKHNMRQFASLGRENLFGQSLAHINGLSDWLGSKTGENVAIILKKARDGRNGRKQKAIEHLEKTREDLLES